MRYFKIQKGYDRDDYISITEDELPMALRAQITGKIAILQEGTIAGNHIMAIVPDWNRAMGWNRNHKLDSEDYAQIGDARRNEYKEYLQLVTQNVQLQLEGKKPVHAINGPKSTLPEAKALADRMRIK